MGQTSPDPHIRLFLCGDVMTGRGIDQVLPHPGDPHIHENHVRSAQTYVQLAERANGPIPRPVDFPYIWGAALDELARARPDARLGNLETSITRNDDYASGRGINYRMHPDNIPCITVARIDCCVLANNHVLDYGYSGPLETVESLRRAGVTSAGAGRNLAGARAPAVLEIPSKGRVVIFTFGTKASGIPADWAATEDDPGLNLLENLSDKTIDQVGGMVRNVKRPRDVVIASIHWGGNWGFDVGEENIRFPHGLVRAGVDVFHGHSSHHVRPIEIFEDKLILYGCGDFLDDYEGNTGYEEFRNDLSLMYFTAIDPSTGRLLELHMTPMQIRHFRFNRASREDARWLADTINRENRRFDLQVELGRRRPVGAPARSARAATIAIRTSRRPRGPSESSRGHR